MFFSECNSMLFSFSGSWLLSGQANKAVRCGAKQEEACAQHKFRAITKNHAAQGPRAAVCTF